jgi:hypothetical protein
MRKKVIGYQLKENGKPLKCYKNGRLALVLESNEVVLSDQCDIAYAQHDNGYSLSEDMVTIVKVGEHSNGEKYIMFKCDCSDSENDEWKYYHEVQSSIAIDIYEAVYQN